MTNKLPVVGRRYKLRNQLGSGNGDIVMVVSVEKDFSCKVYFEKFDRVADEPLSLASFCNICEELPEDNLQENKYKTEAEIWKLLDYNKKYKEKNSSKVVKLNSIGTAEVMFRYEGKNYNEGEYNKCSPSLFLSRFEEL